MGAKIVGIRSQIHPKLRMQDFIGVYNIIYNFNQEGIDIITSLDGFTESKVFCFLVMNSVASFFSPTWTDWWVVGI